MLDRVGRLFRNPVFLVALTAALAAFVIQSGELGTSDTSHRLQTTHSFWTSEPPVFPEEYPEFGIHGRQGKLYGWYGIGQSLLMLPADLAGTFIERLPVFANYDGNDPTVRAIFVSYSTNMLICVLTALVCFRWLGLLGFTANQKIAGVFALLFGTTFLHYAQNMMENNYILLLTLTGLTFQYEWLRTGNRRALLIGSAALGANLLTRLTTGMDLLAVALFLLLAAWFANTRGNELRSRIAEYVKVAAPVYLVFGLMDRAYQYYRFGTIFHTYVKVVAEEHKLLDPTLPAAYPFETPFHLGFLGPLITPEKSIFLFDPLLLLTLIVCVCAWKRFQPEIRAYLIAFALLLLTYICFYAKYTDWAGNDAWGDRYISTAAQLVAFISVPLWMRHRADAKKFVWALGIVLVGISVCVQLSSVMFWCPLEIYQMETRGHPAFVIGLRFQNIAAFAFGKMEQWGLMNNSMKEDPWDYVHITCFNFLPFLLRRVGAAAGWVVNLIAAIWYLALAALVALLLFIRRQAARGLLDAAGEAAVWTRHTDSA
jgi:hypothetical protein